MFLSSSLISADFEKDIELDFERSHGSYLFDTKTQSHFLDLFSFFASNPLGYQHPAFETAAFQEDILRYSKIKISSGRIYTRFFDEFVQEFHQFVHSDIFTRYYFIHGGALAVEAALKIAFDHKRARSGTAPNDLKVISFKNGFHGVSGYCLSLSDLPAVKVDGFPTFNWPRFDSPYFSESGPSQEQKEQAVVDEIREYICKQGAHQIAALLIEPIQCSGGDHSFRPEFFKKLRDLCHQYEVALIYDEIQTGFGVTGSLWYWQQLGVPPDLLIFGKKAQVCGVAVTAPYQDGAMATPHRLPVTWDGHIVDMVRSFHLIQALKDGSIIGKVQTRSCEMRQILQSFPLLHQVRGNGLLLAFDLPSQELRDYFYQAAYHEKLLVNIAAQTCIRMRPSLCITPAEIQDFEKKVARIIARLN